MRSLQGMEGRELSELIMDRLVIDGCAYMLNEDGCGAGIETEWSAGKGCCRFAKTTHTWGGVNKVNRT